MCVSAGSQWARSYVQCRHGPSPAHARAPAPGGTHLCLSTRVLNAACGGVRASCGARSACRVRMSRGMKGVRSARMQIPPRIRRGAVDGRRAPAALPSKLGPPARDTFAYHRESSAAVGLALANDRRWGFAGVVLAALEESREQWFRARAECHDQVSSGSVAITLVPPIADRGCDTQTDVRVARPYALRLLSLGADVFQSWSAPVGCRTYP